MNRPLFFAMKAHHMGRGYLPPQVYDAIGHPELALDPAWHDTCAVRMSVALVGAGIRIYPGRLQIKAGQFKGAWVEPGQQHLSEFLVRAMGQPERYRSAPEARNTIAWRHGIVSFFGLHGGRQGHIDLASVPDWGDWECSLSCYWDCREVWFWDLK